LSILVQDFAIQEIRLGQKLKELREQHKLVQREVTSKLEVDTVYVSKMEKGGKQISRSWLPILAEMFGVNENDLIIEWLADKVNKVIKYEPLGINAINRVLNEQNQ
jgi:transcriptional regulator with XRE-family HTH domain